MHSLSRSALLLVALTLPSVTRAQGVTVQSVADVRLTGALGVAANLAAKLGGGSIHDIATTTYVSGHRLRTESSITGSIIDADAGRITTIDHKQKSYSSMTFAEMSAAIDQAAQSAKQSSAKEKAKEKNRSARATDDSLTFKYKVAVDRPGEKEKVSGYDAERVFVTVTIEAQVASEGQQDQSAGNLVFLIDQWISKDAPQIAALREFQRAYAQKMGQEFRTQVQGLQSVFATDPRMKNGFEAAAKELAKVPGIALKSTTYVSLVPVDVQYDRALTLGDGATAAVKESAAKKDEKPSGGRLRGMMGAMKAAAENASNQSEKQSGKSATPKQLLLMTVVDNVTSSSRGAVPAGMFAPPADYKEIKRP